MAKEVLLERGSVVKTGFVGFSWTVFFFGFFVPLFRKDFKSAFVLLLIGLFLGAFTAGAGAGLLNLIVAFGYNKYYTENLMKLGFLPVDNTNKILLEQYGIYC